MNNHNISSLKHGDGPGAQELQNVHSSREGVCSSLRGVRSSGEDACNSRQDVDKPREDAHNRRENARKSEFSHIDTLSHATFPALCATRARAGWARALADFDRQIFDVDAWPLPAWRSCVVSPNARVFVVVKRGETGEGFAQPAQPAQPSINALDDAIADIVGVGAVGLGPDAEILTIAVSREARGRGVGGWLLETLMREAEKCGAENIFLEVRSRSEGAIRMYESRGFVRVGLRKKYYHDDDALIMQAWPSGEFDPST